MSYKQKYISKSILINNHVKMCYLFIGLCIM
jgi:hypothetical protein